jgi:hypothetical protein
MPSCMSVFPLLISVTDSQTHTAKTVTTTTTGLHPTPAHPAALLSQSGSQPQPLPGSSATRFPHPLVCQPENAACTLDSHPLVCQPKNAACTLDCFPMPLPTCPHPTVTHTGDSCFLSARQFPRPLVCQLENAVCALDCLPVPSPTCPHPRSSVTHTGDSCFSSASHFPSPSFLPT